MSSITRTRILASALLVALATIPAAAQTRDAAPGRFSMQPVDGGFLRLDTQTGAVSMCRPGAGGAVACLPAEGEQRTTLADELARLRAENTALKAEVKRLETIAGTGRPMAPSTEPPEKFQLPSEQDVDQALDYVERMYKKFRDRLQNLDKPSKPGTPL